MAMNLKNELGKLQKGPNKQENVQFQGVPPPSVAFLLKDLGIDPRFQRFVDLFLNEIEESLSTVDTRLRRKIVRVLGLAQTRGKDFSFVYNVISEAEKLGLLRSSNVRSAYTNMVRYFERESPDVTWDDFKGYMR
jgi:hypothetical protein